MAAPCLVLFTKPAVPGRVKTRLIGALAAEQAAELHRAFLGDLLERLLPGRFSLRLAWALAPGEPLPDPAAVVRELALPCGAADRLTFVRQVDGDLGERLHAALVDAASSHAAVAAVGSDHPELALAVVEDAFAGVAAGAGAVFAPAADGGYVLLALPAAGVVRDLFDGIAWSTDRVLAASVERCRAAGCEPTLLATQHDVDTPADLVALANRLGEAPDACPRTRALLVAWGLC